MDSKKKAQFVAKMGKKRLRFAKGGAVPRQKFGIGGLISGLFGGDGGGGVQTPSGASPEHIAHLYDQNQNALTNQLNLTNTLNPQAQNAVDAQNTLSNQFAAQAQGQGPNVATNVLNQATGANVANQAALMAGQRGASANPALLARQAAQQGAAIQQQAAGQAATTQAQQQIAAEQAQAQLANNQISQTQNAASANTQANLNEQSVLQGANTANNQIQGQYGLQAQKQGGDLLSGIAGGAASVLSGGLFAHGGEVAESNPAHPSHSHKKLDFIHKMAKMGMEHFDNGGLAVPNSNYQAPSAMQMAPAQDQANFNPQAADTGNLGENADRLGQASGDAISKLFKPAPLMMAGPDKTDQKEMYAAHGGHVANFLMAEGGKVPAMVSPGEVYLAPDKVDEVVSGGANPLQVGEKIPGKAKVKGDSYKNDFVKKDLQAGGVVIDRENVKDPKKAAKFVHKSIAKKKVKGAR